MGNLTEMNTDNFDSIIGSNSRVLVDFWAPWCGPCRMQTPILEKLSGDESLDVTIAKLNTDEAPEIAKRFGISSIPTIILFKDGNEVERMVGVQPEDSLKAKIKSI